MVKLINTPQLTEWSSQLTERLSGDRILSCTFEIFSCKRTNDEKKVAGKLNARYGEDCKHLISSSLEPEVTLIGAMEGRPRKRGSSVSSEAEGGLEKTQRKRSKSNDYENDPNAGGLAPPSSSRASSVPAKGAPLLPNPATITALGDLSQVATQRLHTDLILTLNATFADYSFESVKASSFKREAHANEVMTTINHKLISSFSSSPQENAVVRGASNLAPAPADVETVVNNLWSAAATVMPLGDCEVFSYQPEIEGDPFSEDGVLWSFNYFFFHKAEKKILYFTCMARSIDRHYNEKKTMMDDDDHRILTLNTSQDDFSEPDTNSVRSAGAFEMDFEE